MIITIPPSTKQIENYDSYQKGLLFEEYVTTLFNRKSFSLEKWRKSGKFAANAFSSDHSNPDLELVFTGKNQYRFAVECKWRKKFIEGCIGWARDYQIRSYERFQNKNRIPVFIVIGIGGEPFNPEKLFVTPLCNISMRTQVYEHHLILYKREPSHRFFYDTVQLKLF